MAAMAATGQPDTAIQQGFGPMVPGFSYARFNDLDDFASKVTDQTIAIMIEPVQGEGGVYFCWMRCRPDGGGRDRLWLTWDIM